jgi:hypothetical protein
LGRFFLFGLGLLLAIPAGLMALAVGVVIEPAARELITVLGAAGVETFLSDLWQDSPAEFVTWDVFLRLWALSATLLVLPPTLVALIGEIAGIRSFVWYGFATGSLTAVLPWLGRESERWAESGAFGAEARITTLLFLTGAAAGLTYWLVAGRSAGHHRTSSSGGA